MNLRRTVRSTNSRGAWAYGFVEYYNNGLATVRMAEGGTRLVNCPTLGAAVSVGERIVIDWSAEGQPYVRPLTYPEPGIYQDKIVWKSWGGTPGDDKPDEFPLVAARYTAPPHNLLGRSPDMVYHRANGWQLQWSTQEVPYSNGLWSGFPAGRYLLHAKAHFSGVGGMENTRLFIGYYYDIMGWVPIGCAYELVKPWGGGGARTDTWNELTVLWSLYPESEWTGEFNVGVELQANPQWTGWPPYTYSDCVVDQLEFEFCRISPAGSDGDAYCNVADGYGMIGFETG